MRVSEDTYSTEFCSSRIHWVVCTHSTVASLTRELPHETAALSPRVWNHSLGTASAGREKPMAGSNSLAYLVVTGTQVTGTVLVCNSQPHTACDQWSFADLFRLRKEREGYAPAKKDKSQQCVGSGPVSNCPFAYGRVLMYVSFRIRPSIYPFIHCFWFEGRRMGSGLGPVP